MSAIFQAACNRVTQPCGCAEWDQLEDGRWVHRSESCLPREIAAATGGAA